ncbi:calymmin isoform X2 [Channa argus]|uniref:calymmin isoform X2 n=1 Tax=Channa argus TaxID=215402 RepID=UPI003521A7D4
MLGQLLLQSVVILWLVQAAYTGGYSAASGVSNGPQTNGNKPQNGGGVGRFPMLSKGVGAQAGYGRYPTKGIGYGAAAGRTNGESTKGYGTAALTNGKGAKPQRHVVQGGTANGQQIKGNGYEAQAGGYGGQVTKGKGYSAAAGVLGLNRVKTNGNGAAASPHNRFGTKGNGHGAAAGPINGNGANGQGRAGSWPLKGYVRPPYSAGVGMEPYGGLGEPQLAKNQGRFFNRNGYNGHGAQPVGGYNGGYGSAGLGLGSQYGDRGIKGLKQGHGATRGGATRPQIGFGNGAVPNGYGTKVKGYGMRNGAALGDYGAKRNGYGAGSKPQTTKGVGAVSPSEGYGGAAGIPNAQLAKGPNSGYGMLPNGKAAKVAGASSEKTPKVLSTEQLNPAPEEHVVLHQRVAPAAPESSSGILAMVTQEKYQGKAYKQMPIIPQGKREPAPSLQGRDFNLQPTSEPMSPQRKPPNAATSRLAPVFPESNPAPKPAVILPEGNILGASVSKGQGPKPDCDPSGVPNGQWMKIPRPGYAASAGGYSDGGTKANKAGGIVGGYTVPGLSAGYGAGLGYPYTGKPKQPGYGNSYGANVQPDYASLGHSLPAEGESGGAKPNPFSGAPVVPSGLDGMSQFEPQSAGLGPSGKLGGVYVGMGNLPFGKFGKTQYGIGGLQFVGQPFSTGTNGAGGLVAGPGEVPVPGKYGYGRMPYQAQTVVLGPDTKSSGKYGLALSPYQPEQVGLRNNGKIGKHDNQELYQLQPHESASEVRSSEAYVKGEVLTPVTAVEGDGMSVDRYESVGYINGQVQPEVVAFPAAPTHSPTLAHPSVPPHSPMESHLIPDVVPGAGVEALPDPAGAASLTFDSAPATETQGVTQGPEQPLDFQQQQLPRQVHIQQHLKLHFHPQNKSWRGANNGKYDVNGFFGKNGYQG